MTWSPATAEALRGRYPAELERVWQPSGGPPLLLRPQPDSGGLVLVHLDLTNLAPT